MALMLNNEADIITQATAEALQMALRAEVGARMQKIIQPELDAIVQRVCDQITAQIHQYREVRAHRDVLQVEVHIHDARTP